MPTLGSQAVTLSLSKDGCLPETALFDGLRVLVLPTPVLVLGSHSEPVEE